MLKQGSSLRSSDSESDSQPIQETEAARKKLRTRAPKSFISHCDELILECVYEQKVLAAASAQAILNLLPGFSKEDFYNERQKLMAEIKEKTKLPSFNTTVFFDSDDYKKRNNEAEYQWKMTMYKQPLPIGTKTNPIKRCFICLMGDRPWERNVKSFDTHRKLFHLICSFGHKCLNCERIYEDPNRLVSHQTFSACNKMAHPQLLNSQNLKKIQDSATRFQTLFKLNNSGLWKQEVLSRPVEHLNFTDEMRKLERQVVEPHVNKQRHSSDYNPSSGSKLLTTQDKVIEKGNGHPETTCKDRKKNELKRPSPATEHFRNETKHLRGKNEYISTTHAPRTSAEWFAKTFGNKLNQHS